jgi:hypothetical protein
VRTTKKIDDNKIIPDPEIEKIERKYVVVKKRIQNQIRS